MTGADGKPLLLLSRYGEGRVALLLSDHIWLWARGYEGGGPHLDLLRRMSHWLMKQPELDEEALRLQVQGKDLVGAAPDHGRQRRAGHGDLALRQDARTDAERRRTRPVARDIAGRRTRTVAGDRRHAESADQCRPDQSEGIFRGHLHHRRCSSRWRKPPAATRGALSDGSGIDAPRIVPVRASSVFRGDGWMGVKMRDASVVRGVGVLPMFAGLIGLLLLLGAFAATWLREGR